MFKKNCCLFGTRTRNMAMNSGDRTADDTAVAEECKIVASGGTRDELDWGIPGRQRPPNRDGAGGFLKDVGGLMRSLVRGDKKNRETISESFLRWVVFYASHTVLLGIFFCISIYKNIEYIYRRVFLKFLTLAYYPSKTPQLIRDDVNKLAKLPKRVSCILDLKDDDDENGGVDGLISDISELTAWSILAGVPVLSIYEYSGIVQHHLPELCRYIVKNLSVYFGTESVPVFSIRIPHSNTVIYSNNLHQSPTFEVPRSIDLEISLLSKIDGKPTIIELTKSMCELAANNELSIKDITIDLIDEELIELVGVEPDLLISFGPSLDLQDYPPWHIRLSEIYWEADNQDVNYSVFIRALQKYSNCKVNVGK